MSLYSVNPLMNKFWREGMELQPRWFELFDNLGIKFDYKSEESEKTQLNFEFLQLFYRYSEERRFYHTPKHLLECFREVNQVGYLTDSLPEVSLALWFHDVVYDPRAKDNEEKSSQYTQEVLKRLGLPEASVQRVGNLVLVTKHNVEPRDLAEGFIIDADLSILGKSEEVFDEYESNIRKEYSWVKEEDFKKGRTKVLESFLARDSVYYTDFFRDRYEVRARENLERSMKKLRI